MSASLLLVLVSLLIVKHTLADYVLQTKSMLARRQVYLHKGRVGHVLIHAVGTFAAFMLVGAPLGVAGVMAAVDAVAHFHIDWVKGVLSDRLSPDVRSARYWHLHGTDQMLHLLTYVALAAAWLSWVERGAL